MKVSVNKGIAGNTPAAVMNNYVSDHVSALMVLCGIKSLRVTKYEIGLGSATSAEAEFFDDVPREGKTCGYVIRDALAQVMTSANIMGLSVAMEGNEAERMRNSWASTAAESHKPMEAAPSAGDANQDGGSNTEQ